MSDRKLRAIVGVTIILGISKVLGMGREMVIADRFGTSVDYDLYLIAVMLPALAYGIINFASFYLLVPYLTKTMPVAESSGENERWRHIWTLFNVAALIAAGLAIAISLVAPVLVRVWTGDISSGQYDRVVLYARATSVIVVLGTMEAFFRAILNTRKLFAYPSGGPIIENLLAILIIVSLSRTMSVGAIVCGVIGGLLAQNIYLAARLRALGFFKCYTFSFRHAGALVLVPTAALLVVIELLNRSYFLVDRYVAPQFGAGVISALNYGQVLVQLPDAIVGFAIASVVFPHFSEAQATGDNEQFANVYREAILGGLLISAPVAVFFLTGASEIIQLVFLRGVFDSSSLDLTSRLLIPYAPTIVALTIISTSIRACYSRGWTALVLVFTVMTLVTKVTATLLLAARFGFPGIAAATTVSQWLFALLLVWLVVARMPSFSLKTLLVPLSRIVICACAALVTVLAANPLLQARFPGHSTIDAVSRLGISGAILFAVYVALVYILGLGSYMSRIVRTRI